MLLWLINILQANHSCYPPSGLRGVPFPDVPLQLGMKVEIIHPLLLVAACMGVGLLLIREVGTGMCRRLVLVDFLFLFIALLLAVILTGQGTEVS